MKKVEIEEKCSKEGEPPTLDKIGRDKGEKKDGMGKGKRLEASDVTPAKAWDTLHATAQTRIYNSKETDNDATSAVELDIGPPPAVQLLRNSGYLGPLLELRMKENWQMENRETAGPRWQKGELF